MKKTTKKPAKAASSKKAKKPQKPQKTLAQALKKAPKVLKSLAKDVKKAADKIIAAPPAKKGKAQAPVEPVAKLGKGGKKAEVMNQLAAAQAKEEDIILTNADGKQYCRVHDCDSEGNTDGYCRFHYLALWKRNKIKAKILQGGKLDKYIEDLTAKYPDKYLEMLRKDLASEKDFTLIINEMDVEDSNEESESEEEASRFIEEVRGGVPTGDDDEGGY
jgi:hypothetical protein